MSNSTTQVLLINIKKNFTEDSSAIKYFNIGKENIFSVRSTNYLENLCLIFSPVYSTKPIQRSPIKDSSPFININFANTTYNFKGSPQRNGKNPNKFITKSDVWFRQIKKLGYQSPHKLEVNTSRISAFSKKSELHKRKLKGSINSINLNLKNKSSKGDLINKTVCKNDFALDLNNSKSFKADEKSPISVEFKKYNYQPRNINSESKKSPYKIFRTLIETTPRKNNQLFSGNSLIRKIRLTGRDSINDNFNLIYNKRFNN